MIGVHTYIPNENFKDGFTRNLAYNMLLSVHLAKFSFDKIVLYTNKEIEIIVRRLNIPYDEIITEPFDGFSSKTFSVPKIITYSLQTEPFAHIDLDTFIYSLPKKLEEIPVFYASQDIPLKPDNTFQSNESMYNTYMKGTFEISDKLDPNFKKHIDFFDIPNMCIFGGTDYELIKKASEYCLMIYNDNKDHFDSNYYYACIIEQLFINAAIKMFKEESEIKEDDILIEKDNNIYIFDSTKNLSIKHQTDSLTNVTYPMILEYYDRKKIIKNEIELFALANYDFDSIIHLCGNKFLDAILFIVRETIIQRFNGFDSIRRMNDIFGKESDVENISKEYYRFLGGNLNIWNKTSKSLV